MQFEKLFGNACYIKASNNQIYPYFRKSFFVNEEIVKAELTVSVLGFGEIYCNGRKINKDLYITPYSQYNEQGLDDVNEYFRKDAYFDEEHGHSIYVSKYDVAHSIVLGANVIGFVVAGGWYQSGLDKHNAYRNYGDLAVCFRLQLTTASGKTYDVVSDESCKSRKNFLTKGGVFGEEQNENDEISNFSCSDYDDSRWDGVLLATAPNAEYRDEPYARQIIGKHVTPKLIKEGKNYKIYDVGINTTGYPIITTDACKNVVLECVYSEERTEDNELDENHIYAQKSTFLTDGRREHFIRFTWHGFRYFKVVTSEPMDFSCEKVAIVHADVKRTSTFICDEETVNWLHDAYINSQLTNYQCSVPTDCPQIERKGYTGDGQLLCELGMTLFNSQILYRKWLQDIADGQDKISGSVSYTAPIFVGCGGGPGGWGIAIVNVPYFYYKVYGDIEVLKEFYPKMLRYIDYLKAHSQNDLVVSAQPGAWNLGEWHTRDKIEISSVFVNSCFHCIALLRMQEICEILGNEQDISMLAARYEIVKKAIQKEFLDENTGDYCGNVQGANAFAIKAGIADAKTVKRLIDFYKQEKSFNVGIFGLDFVSSVLLENGEGDLFIEMLNADKEGCFLEWKKAGATTLYEDWKNARSHNHPMFGSVVKYFYQYILGIKQCEKSNSYQEIEISPLKFEKITKASGEIQTKKGRISVAFLRVGDKTEFHIELPDNIKATFNFNGVAKLLQRGKNVLVV